MSDPVLALVLLASFFAATAAAAAFSTLDARLWTEARIPLIAGVVAGVLIRFSDFVPSAVAAGLILTAVALYARLIGRESEPSSGMTLGALSGAAASFPLVIAGGDELLRLAECILAGSVAGFGITFALTHVRARTRQALLDVVTAGLAIGIASIPTALSRMPRLSDQHIAAAAVAIIPILIIATVFKRWPEIRAELRDEARLGVIDEEDVRATAHPLLRLGRGGWHDAHAHREFVRLATRIALRKRQQRSRPEEIARLYQLEVIKLRMSLQEMTRIDYAMRARAADGEHSMSS
jgi:hypothetical protein